MKDNRIYGIIGAVIGDIAGSSFEFSSSSLPKKKDFKLFRANSSFTDDSVLTMAVAQALMQGTSYEEAFMWWIEHYPAAGFGYTIKTWKKGKGKMQVNGNTDGSGMRIAPVGFYGKSLDEVLRLAEKATIPTHNSPEGIRAAQAIAASIFLARTGKSKAEIKCYVESTFGYNLDQTDEAIRAIADDQNIKILAEAVTPVAIIAFLRGEEFEDVVRTAILYGGDTDTVACMAGAIAAAFYGVPSELAEEAAYYLPEDLLKVINAFDHTNLSNHRVTPPSVDRWGTSTVVVYASNADDTEGEKGFSDTHGSKYCHHPLSGYPIHIIGTQMETVQHDVQELIARVEREPETTFLIMNIGLGKKANVGIDVMAPLFAPLKDKANVYFTKEYWAAFSHC